MESVFISKRAFYLRPLTHMGLLILLLLSPLAVLALPPPLSLEELAGRSDLVIEGRVTRVWPYPQWLAYVKEGGLGTRGKALLQEAPPTEEGMLGLIRNFPYKSLPGVQVSVEGVYLAQVQVEQTLKGQADKVIFIPFVRFHFLTDRRLEGPWTERQYQVGEYLKLYLRQNGPFFESTWWNAVRPVKE